ncbi:hypothetical protein ACEN9X_20750 [Mucilaginibacter sp. Mucisp86]|uniref:hypothetical protein n=1 Tax=Mucilaginibacter sp. Mucisp86 TaxID=3243060 RepID=UPI0039B5CF72
MLRKHKTTEMVVKGYVAATISVVGISVAGCQTEPVEDSREEAHPSCFHRLSMTAVLM